MSGLERAGGADSQEPRVQCVRAEQDELPSGAELAELLATKVGIFVDLHNGCPGAEAVRGLQGRITSLEEDLSDARFEAAGAALAHTNGLSSQAGVIPIGELGSRLRSGIAAVMERAREHKDCPERLLEAQQAARAATAALREFQTEHQGCVAPGEVRELEEAEGARAEGRLDGLRECDAVAPAMMASHVATLKTELIATLRNRIHALERDRNTEGQLENLQSELAALSEGAPQAGGAHRPQPGNRQRAFVRASETAAAIALRELTRLREENAAL